MSILMLIWAAYITEPGIITGHGMAHIIILVRLPMDLAYTTVLMAAGDFLSEYLPDGSAWDGMPGLFTGTGDLQATGMDIIADTTMVIVPEPGPVTGEDIIMHKETTEQAIIFTETGRMVLHGQAAADTTLKQAAG